MKILNISLLRSGDLLLQEEIFLAIKKKHPESEVHILINEECSNLFPLIKGIDQVHVFERRKLQDKMRVLEVPFLSPYFDLKLLVEKLNAFNFDLIYNLTHNKLSARLMDLLKAPEKEGVNYTNGQVSSFRNPWISYFNDFFSENKKSHFHYVDILSFSLGLPLVFQENPKNKNKYINQAQAEDQDKDKDKDRKSSPVICLQVLTSDEKKNWGINNFKILIQELLKNIPSCKIIILAAPQEKLLLETEFHEELSFQEVSGQKVLSQVSIEACNFVEAYEILKNCSLLVSGDTSILHLAVKAKIPTLSLFLGSANPSKTFPRQENATVLFSKVSCFPCFHKVPCPHSQYFCKLEITPSLVLQEVKNIVLDQNLDFQFENLLHQVRFFNKSLRIYPLRKEKFMEEILAENIKQCVWQMYLDEEGKNFIKPFGSNAKCLFDEFYDSEYAYKIPQILEGFVKTNEESFVVLDKIEFNMKAYSLNFIAGKKISMLAVDEKLIGFIKQDDFFFRLKETLQNKSENSFLFYKNLREAFEESKTLIEIENKLLISLKKEFEERGLYANKTAHSGFKSRDSIEERIETT